MLLLKILFILSLSYLIGSITTGDIVAKIKGVNLRNQGSGNVGATNVYRTMGSFYAAIVLIGDALKGIIAVLLGNMLGKAGGFDWPILTGILAIIGHNWPVFSKFKGGKGMATSLGVVIALTPWSLTISLSIWIVIFIICGYVSLASILAALSYPFTVYWFYHLDLYKLMFAVIIAVLAIYRHKANIKRLIRGEEHRILYRNKKEAGKG